MIQFCQIISPVKNITLYQPCDLVEPTPARSTVPDLSSDLGHDQGHGRALPEHRISTTQCSFLES